MKPFTNPWYFSSKEKSYGGNDKLRVCRCLNTYIPVNIYKDLFASVRFVQDPHMGTIGTTLNLLLEKLHVELQRRGITDFSHVQQYEHFIANSVLVLPNELAGGTSNGINTEATRPDDRRGTEGEGSGTKNLTQFNTVAEVGSFVTDAAKTKRPKTTRGKTGNV